MRAIRNGAEEQSFIVHVVLRHLMGCSYSNQSEGSDTLRRAILEVSCTPRRSSSPLMSQEMGLELSLDLMLALTRTFWAAVYDGVLLLKGFNTMLTPTLKTGDSVVWHLTVDKSGDRLSYNDGVGSSCLHTVGEAIFDGARHFVGWTTSANLLVGKFIPSVI